MLYLFMSHLLNLFMLYLFMFIFMFVLCVCAVRLFTLYRDMLSRRGMLAHGAVECTVVVCCGVVWCGVVWSALQSKLEAARPYFDDTLSRQFARLKKAGVATITYLQTHSDLLQLVMPAAPLDAVLKASGDWSKVGDQVSQLLSCGNLGKTVFSFAGLHANAAAFAGCIEIALAKLADDGITAENIQIFKDTMSEKTEEYKATCCHALVDRLVCTFRMHIIFGLWYACRLCRVGCVSSVLFSVMWSSSVCR